MRSTASLASARLLLVVIWTVIGLIGAAIAAQAQDRPPGQLAANCVAACNLRNYSADYCNRVCWVPDRPQSRPDEVTDWRCMTACRDQGGSYAECKPRCQVR